MLVRLTMSSMTLMIIHCIKTLRTITSVSFNLEKKKMISASLPKKEIEDIVINLNGSIVATSCPSIASIRHVIIHR